MRLFGLTGKSPVARSSVSLSSRCEHLDWLSTGFSEVICQVNPAMEWIIKRSANVKEIASTKDISRNDGEKCISPKAARQSADGEGDCLVVSARGNDILDPQLLL